MIFFILNNIFAAAIHNLLVYISNWYKELSLTFGNLSFNLISKAFTLLTRVRSSTQTYTSRGIHVHSKG